MDDTPFFTVSQPLYAEALNHKEEADFYDAVLTPGTIYIALNIDVDSIIVGRTDSIPEDYLVYLDTPEEWACIQFESPTNNLSHLLKLQQEC